MSQESYILQVKDLVTSFSTEQGTMCAVNGVSFDLRAGQILGIVGESGCGKSVTSLSVMRLLPQPHGRIEAGQILFKGRDLVSMTLEEIHELRGNRISMIFQEPMTALNPVHKVGKQIGEVLRIHGKTSTAQETQKQVLELLSKVGIPSPEQRFHEYPHQLSGGMRQRVMIAMAIACKPDILIADEPTTALDVTIQAQILELLKTLQNESDTAIVFITHDLGVIAEMCDTVLVMYAGNVVETASVEQLFSKPRHPYTQGLLNLVPRLDRPRKQKLSVIPGMVPDLHELPAGCRFQNRCDWCQPACQSVEPMLEQVVSAHWVRCVRWRDIIKTQSITNGNP
ncbi:MAG: ABC transporter ATP-binding protein [SAR324 cluster bacterium]|nr:ABC transporter ATP-binding protein [SAR324 cluster bacterium]